MRIRAAVAVAAGKPPESKAVNLAGPKAGAGIRMQLFGHATGRAWKQSASGSAQGRGEAPRIAGPTTDRQIGIDPMINPILPPHRLSEGFGLVHRGESIRLAEVR